MNQKDNGYIIVQMEVRNVEWQYIGGKSANTCSTHAALGKTKEV
jgi:hypothetical protein